ncbi:MAG: alpha/beta hydrolase [Clostridia bacterium]|nr:alpha/beta hydrolase [Clostridia bacterium]
MRWLLFLLITMIVILLALYWLYHSIFCNPERNRPDAHNIPESTLYKEHREVMAEAVNDMESTPFEEVSILSADGYRLYGRLYIMEEAAPLMIFFHGYHGVYAWDGYGFFKICKNNGINILMVDERAHGKSGGNEVTFGIKERYDCKLWVEYAAERFGENKDLLLAGVSMGASSVIMASELGFPQSVKAVIADCGYSEPAAIIKEIIKKMKLPVEAAYMIVKISAQIFGHFNLEEAAALQAVKKIQIPILFIHGKNDSVVPVYMCNQLYENCQSTGKLLIIEGADHANSAMTDYEAYENAVVEFLKIIY